MIIGYPPERPLVYVIARYSSPEKETVFRNIQRAVDIGSEINRTGLAWAVVPHQVGRGMEKSLPTEGWYGMTRALMRRCDAAWVVDSDTVGCEGEIADALARQLPVGFWGGIDLKIFLAGLVVPQ